MFQEDWAIRGRIGWSVNIKMKQEYENGLAECQVYNCVQRAITRSKLSQATSHPKVLEQIAKVDAQSMKQKHVIVAPLLGM